MKASMIWLISWMWIWDILILMNSVITWILNPSYLSKERLSVLTDLSKKYQGTSVDVPWYFYFLNYRMLCLVLGKRQIKQCIEK